jgi:geranylgeranyl reductase family protein
MKKTCDVLVVGLGPAGGAAATHAARAGADVLAIDKKKVVGEPVQCGEFIPFPLGKYAQGKDVMRQRIDGMKSHLPSGAVRESAFPGYMIDRRAFDQALAAMAQEAGASLHPRTTLELLDTARGVATLRDAAGLREVGFRYLIAADGPYSKVAQLLGLPRQKLVHSRQYTVPLLDPLQDTIIWLSADYPGGYAWLFPRGEVANLGLGIDHEYERDARHPLDRLHKQLIDDGVVGWDISRRTGGAIPVGGMREHLVVGNVLLSGDAAGLTHPITGAGISAAVVSGEAAGRAAGAALRGDQAALSEFENEVREQFGGTIERALRVRKSLEWVWKTPQASDDAAHRRGWIAFEEYFAF